MDTEEISYLDGGDKDEMKTLVSCLNSLSSVGYRAQFKALKKGLKSLDTKRIYKPSEVRITNFYRFEGESDPSDNSILYAIVTDSGEKGTLTDAYGAYSDPHVAGFIRRVEEIKKRTHKKGKPQPEAGDEFETDEEDDEDVEADN